MSLEDIQQPCKSCTDLGSKLAAARADFKRVTAARDSIWGERDEAQVRTLDLEAEVERLTGKVFDLEQTLVDYDGANDGNFVTVGMVSNWKAIEDTTSKLMEWYSDPVEHEDDQKRLDDRIAAVRTALEAGK